MVRLGDAALYHGDCFEVLKELEDDSIDTVITDPPAGISFIGIERGEEAFEMAVKRIDHWQRQGVQLSLFGD